MMLDNHHLEGLASLEKTSQMFFDDIPMAFLQVAILYQWIECPELNEEAAWLVYFVFFSKISNVGLQFYLEFIASRALGQGWIIHSL
jgi:hypothetical protein